MAAEIDRHVIGDQGLLERRAKAGEIAVDTVGIEHVVTEDDLPAGRRLLQLAVKPGPLFLCRPRDSGLYQLRIEREQLYGGAVGSLKEFGVVSRRKMPLRILPAVVYLG